METARFGHAHAPLALGLALYVHAAGPWGLPADSSGIATAPPASLVSSRVEAVPSGVRAWQTGVLRPDRLQHFSLGFSLGLALGIMADEPAAAGGVCALALAKEIADSRNGRFDTLDLITGIAGAALAALTLSALDP